MVTLLPITPFNHLKNSINSNKLNYSTYKPQFKQLSWSKKEWMLLPNSRRIDHSSPLLKNSGKLISVMVRRSQFL